MKKSNFQFIFISRIAFVQFFCFNTLSCMLMASYVSWQWTILHFKVQHLTNVLWDKCEMWVRACSVNVTIHFTIMHFSTEIYYVQDEAHSSIYNHSSLTRSQTKNPPLFIINCFQFIYVWIKFVKNEKYRKFKIRIRMTPTLSRLCSTLIHMIDFFDSWKKIN